MERTIASYNVGILLIIHNPSRERCQYSLFLGDEVVNNLGLIHGVGMVDGMPLAGSHYNLGLSRGPDKIGSRAGPGPRAVSCTWLLYGMAKVPVTNSHVKKLEVTEMKMCRWACGHTLRDHLRNDSISETEYR